MSGDDIPERAGVERRATGLIDSARSFVNENTRLVAVAALVVVILQWAGIISLGLPSWWPIAAVVGAASIIVGWWFADRADSLLPGSERVWIIDMSNESVHWFTPDEFDSLDKDGTLYQWDQGRARAYEVAEYRPNENRLIGNWCESEPSSELRSQEDIEDAWGAIRDIRDNLEPSARRGRKLRRQMTGIVRQLDARRDREMAASLERETVDRELENATITQVLSETLDDELSPDPHAGGDDTNKKQNGHSDGSVSIESAEYEAILDDPETGENPPLGGL
jgi:hypothetical protein